MDDIHTDANPQGARGSLDYRPTDAYTSDRFVEGRGHDVTFYSETGRRFV